MNLSAVYKNRVGKRVLAGTLAVTVGASCLATNFFGFGPGTSDVKAAENQPHSALDYRSSFMGDYEEGNVYYDIGTLYGHAYWDEINKWKDNGSESEYQSEGWDIYNVSSFLDTNKDGLDDKNRIVNTIPYTTDINTASLSPDRELMCWQVYASKQANRHRYLERTDIPDFGTPTYKGDSTPAYYIAKGTVERDAETNEVYISWDVRSWVKDSTTWIKSDTFSDESLTGVSSMSSLENHFNDLDQTVAYDELSKMWAKADFDSETGISKSLTFGDTVDTWWEGVGANIYTADASYSGTFTDSGIASSNGTRTYSYNTHITVDSVKDILNKSYDYKIDADTKSSIVWTYSNGSLVGSDRRNGSASVSDGGVLYTVGNTISDNVAFQIARKASYSDDLSNALTVNTNTFADGITMTRAINPTSVAVKISPTDIGIYVASIYDGAEWNGSKLTFTGKLCKEFADKGMLANATYNDTSKYTILTKTDGNWVCYTGSNTNSALLNLLKDYFNHKTTGSYDQWLFDDTRESVKAHFGIETEEELDAVMSSIQDVKISYDATTGVLTLSDLSFCDTTYDNTIHATNFPIINYISGIMSAGSAVTANVKMYFSTGYQRSGGLIRAKRVSNDTFNTFASTDDAKNNTPKIGVADNNATVSDAVYYSNLTPGTSYVLVGALYDAETGYAIKADGTVSTETDVIKFNPSSEYAVSKVTFTPESADGNTVVDFTYNASKLAGKNIVVCEKLYLADGAVVAEHTDKTDSNQTISIAVPSVKTVASSSEDTKVIDAVSSVEIKDTISYTGLVPGVVYTITTTVYDKTAGQLLNASSTATLLPTQSDGETTVSILLDASDLIGHSLVVYESLSSDVMSIEHADANDADQMVTVKTPSLKTVANQKTHNVKCAVDSVIVDEVSYAGLSKNHTYTLKASIYDESENKWYKDLAEKTFSTGNNTSGKVSVSIQFDTSDRKGHKLVVGETLYLDGKVVVTHEDVSDEDQTVTVEVPSIHTTAYNSAKSSKNIACHNNVTIIDTVVYQNLTAGKEYTLIAGLYDKSSKKWLVESSEPVVFTATDANGSVDVPIKSVDTTALAGHSLVVVETLKDGNKTLVNHNDLDDVDQTVTVESPSISTLAVGQNTVDNKVVDCSETAVIIDKVSYTNLVSGETYTLKAGLWDNTTNAWFVENVKTDTFKAKGSNGTVDMNITVDTTSVKGHELTVIQTLYFGNTVLVNHVDKTGPQTVKVKAPGIDTVASSTSGDKKIDVLSSAVVVDKVSYLELIPGEEYTLTATVYDVTNGNKPVDGSVVTKTFTPDAEDGSVDVSINLDTTGLAGHTLVVTEVLTLGSKTVAEHTDLTDTDQQVTVKVPEIKTVATNKAKTSHNIDCADDTVIIDEVSYKNLSVGTAYTLTAGLYDITDSVWLSRSAGTTTFTPDKSDGSVDVTITLDTTAKAGHKIVVVETLTADGKTIVNHDDINDADQTVSVNTPSIGTNAKDKASETKTLAYLKDAVIIDTVNYENLVPGKTYTLTARVYDKSSGKMVDINDVTKTFVPEQPSGSVDMEIQLNTLDMPSSTLVVFEKLYIGNALVADHENPDDEEQTVTVAYPGIDTVAFDEITGTHKGVVSDTVSLSDTISYTGLTAGETYTAVTNLYNKATGDKLNSTEYKTSFTPNSSNGSVVVANLTLSGLALKNIDIVVYETVIDSEGNIIAIHADINDADQTVSYELPEIDTVATDATGESKTVECASSTIILDKVTYKGLTPNSLLGSLDDEYNVYTAVTSVYDITDGNKVLATTTTTFTADKADGTFDVNITVDTTKLKGHQLVVGEVITYLDKEVVRHEDMKDKDQTVSVDVPNIRTNASSKLTGNHTMEQSATAVIVDRVTYSGLKAGQKYTVTATPYNKATGKAIEGVAPVTVEFTAKNSDGYIDVEVPVDTTKLAKQSIVMFESVKENGIEIAVHNDINDADQTVTVSSVDTVATSNGSHELERNKTVTVVDKVSYTGLTVGETYVITGQLVDKSNASNVVANASLEFTPTESDGVVEVTYTLDTTGKEGQSFVCFESVSQKSNGALVGEHKDINDKDQTVTVKPDTPDSPETGDHSNMPLHTALAGLFFIGFLAFAGFAAVNVIRRRTDK